MGDCPVCLDKLGTVRPHSVRPRFADRASSAACARPRRPLCPTCRAPIVTFAVVSARCDEGASDDDEGGRVAVDEHVLVVPRGPSPDGAAAQPAAHGRDRAAARAVERSGRFTTTCSLVMLLYFLYITVHVLFPTSSGSVTYCRVGHAVLVQGDAPAALASTCSRSTRTRPRSFSTRGVARAVRRHGWREKKFFTAPPVRAGARLPPAPRARRRGWTPTPAFSQSCASCAKSGGETRRKAEELRAVRGAT